MTDLVALLGQDHVDTLSKAVGGTRLYVPKHFGRPPGGGRDSSDRLVELFGEPLAILLVFHFGDSRIYVPKGSTSGPVDVGKMNRLSRRMSQRQVARRLGCSERTVEKHRARTRTKTLKRKGIDCD